ncbi:prolipoprotein diacylglyceryl transferase [Halobacillus litoralis]|uniref:prolipoprotein diacylglyceryl transferase n=1 Tax=Halobacillus litoralis TaxID=45668 RepID=UPI002490B9A0|nr:prolipoprotein diacylglyceryl transferase [Halobacillus litoralis]
MPFTNESLDRVFIYLGPLPIYWYGVIIATGAFLGLFLAIKESERIGIKKDYIVDIVVYAIPLSLISARFYYVLFEWDRYMNGPLWKVFAIWEGGIAIHGALIGAFLTAYFYCRHKRVSFWMMADIAAPSIILGQAIGRWGNFMNQEAHGGPVSDEFYQNYMRFLPDFINQQMFIDGTLYHPTFLYESLWNIGGFLFLLLLRYKGKPRRGEVFMSYVIWYSIGRFFIEGLRTDSLYLFGEIRTAQFISILLILFAVIGIMYRRKSGSANLLYSGKKVK